MTSLVTGDTISSRTAVNYTPSMTPEAKVKELGGTIKFYKFYTGATFADPVAGEYFLAWMEQNDNYSVSSFEAGVIAYRASRTRKNERLS